MNQQRIAIVFTSLGTLAVLGQFVILPLILGLLSGGLGGIVFGFIYTLFLATLFGAHILVWHAVNLTCFFLGLKLVWTSPQEAKPGMKRVIGLALTIIPVLVLTLVLVFGEGHAV